MIKSEFFWSRYIVSREMQSEHTRGLAALDRKLEFFVTQLAQVRMERQMASLGFNLAPIKCDPSYLENMYVAAIVNARRERADMIDHISHPDQDVNIGVAPI